MPKPRRKGYQKFLLASRGVAELVREQDAIALVDKNGVVRLRGRHRNNSSYHCKTIENVVRAILKRRFLTEVSRIAVLAGVAKKQGSCVKDFSQETLTEVRNYINYVDQNKAKLVEQAQNQVKAFLQSNPAKKIYPKRALAEKLEAEIKAFEDNLSLVKSTFGA